MADIVQIINEPLLIEVWQGNDWTSVNYGEDVTVYGNLSFLSLCDTPNSFEGQSGKVPVVNSTEDGLTFEDVIGNKFTNLKDCPNTYQNAGTKVVRVKSDETGLEFVNTVGDITVIPFTDLADVPPTYDGASKKVVQVSPGENGLEFNDINNVLPKLINAPGRYPFATVTVDEKGRITAIEGGRAGTILPNYDSTHLLIGNGTDIPVAFNNADTAHKFLTTLFRAVEGRQESYPAWVYISQLYNSRGLLALDCTNDGSSGHYLQVHSSPDGITIVPRCPNDTNSNVSLSLVPQSRGALYLGNSTTSGIHAYSSLNIHTAYITADNYIMLQPKGTGTVRVNPSQLITASYTDNVTDINDLTNKGYVDKAIKDAINTMQGDKSQKCTVPVHIAYNISNVTIGTIKTGSYIDEVRVFVEIPFSESVYMTIGDDVDNDYILDATYLPRSGVYTFDVYAHIQKDSVVKAYFYTTGGTKGSGYVYIKYFE